MARLAARHSSQIQAGAGRPLKLQRNVETLVGALQYRHRRFLFEAPSFSGRRASTHGSRRDWASHTPGVSAQSTMRPAQHLHKRSVTAFKLDTSSKALPCSTHNLSRLKILHERATLPVAMQDPPWAASGHHRTSERGPMMPERSHIKCVQSSCQKATSSCFRGTSLGERRRVAEYCILLLSMQTSLL